MPAETSVYVGPQYVQEIGEDGPYTAEKYGLVAEVGDHRYHHFKIFDSFDAATNFLEKTVLPAIKSKPGWNPSQSEYWSYWGAIYGTDSWGSEGEHACQKLDVEAEYGPGSYQPNHPGYLKTS